MELTAPAPRNAHARRAARWVRPGRPGAAQAGSAQARLSSSCSPRARGAGGGARGHVGGRRKASGPARSPPRRQGAGRRALHHGPARSRPRPPPPARVPPREPRSGTRQRREGGGEAVPSPQRSPAARPARGRCWVPRLTSGARRTRRALPYTARG